MLVDDFNASHSDIQVQLIVEDDKADPKDAVSATQKLISVDGVEVILGSLFSAGAVSSATIAQSNKIPFITPTASSYNISNIGDYVYRYRNDDFAAQRVAQYLNQQGVEKLLFIGENTDSGVGYRDGLKKYFNGEVTDIIVQTDEKDYKLLAKQIKSASKNVDYLFFFPVNDASAVAIINAMKTE
jgi:branched-chain amino acid transport system substrate-binding protein